MVLSGTIRYEKNLKAISAKILAQICAKIGGVPWAFEKMPLMEKRTMLCGLNIYHHKMADSFAKGLVSSGDVSVMGLVASYNKTGTKYWSASELMADAG